MTDDAQDSGACLFCGIAKKEVEAVVIHEDELILAFLDIAPLRPGHTQIIPKRHVETFEALEPETANAIMALAQRLARRMKQVYNVERIAMLFTGGDHPHAHAHVVPMHQKTDITSARYIVSDEEVEWGAQHLLVGKAELMKVREQLGAF